VADPAARATGEDLSRLLVAAVAVAGATGAVFGFDTFVFAWVAHFALMAWMASALTVVRPGPDGPWFRVRPWEPPLYRRLGVWAFMRMLRRAGWERAMRGSRAFDGTGSSLAGLDRDTRTSECGHLILPAVGTALAVVAGALGARHAFARLPALNLPLRLYPVLLQRAVRARVDRLRG
jgi:hypothetical protein